MTPPSEDSSPSPPNTTNDHGGNDDGGDPALKRKASEGDFDDDGPSSKSQHTGGEYHTNQDLMLSDKPGSHQEDDERSKEEHRCLWTYETRLMKRKEQNRAAQRAFRERKEKHVKDLEDKVASLEAKNERAESENENLRDLLTHLQQENLSLKNSSFTFSVPKTGATSSESPQASTSFASQSPEFSGSSSSRSSTSPVVPNKNTNPLEWSSMTTFDPAMLSLLDDTPQPTATDGAMAMDFGFGPHSGLVPNANTPFTQITSNPMFMSFAYQFDSPLPVPATQSTEPPRATAFNNFDINTFTSTWSPPASNQDSSLDDLLGGLNYFMPTPAPGSVASESPVTHHVNPTGLNNLATQAANPTLSPASVFSSTSSPSSSNSDPLFDTPRGESSASESDRDVNQSPSQSPHLEGPHAKKDCPRTKCELVKKIVDDGPSPFAPANLRRSSDESGNMIACEGTKFPMTQKSDANIEVLSAWRSITSNPQFKNVDINDLCTEFTNKAKCDGTKVVLDPQGVDFILQTLSTPKQ
ncbi:hypothetical protein DXG03_001971 [Asterophora parasitica]|uniref:BZIP domain-containing protein n=1 Tax=Asterophora parasitica TaxID=117018 RepID=A0A9P7GCM6_9AGAR|nr:hypothetical protein DXG03_001971 [Asterophora parasitica]